MNAYDQRYEIRKAKEEDIPKIMSFISQNWREDHIMATNRLFFEYEFLESDGSVNFILAIDREKETIEAINGILKASHDSECLDIFGSFWKTLSGNMGFLGLELIKRKNTLFGARAAIGVGDNPKTSVPLMKILHRYTSKMKHYYRLAERDDYLIAKIECKHTEKITDSMTGSIVEYKDIEELKNNFDVEAYKDKIPYKDAWYINHRFFNHPIYKYNVYGIEQNGMAKAIIVLRREVHNSRIAIRFVDYIGDESVFSVTRNFFDELLQEQEVEYIDFYCEGFNDENIISAGFIQLQEGDSNIIPNYFNPFLQENIDIYVSSSEPNTRFTKADADQDRPN